MPLVEPQRAEADGQPAELGRDSGRDSVPLVLDEAPHIDAVALEVIEPPRPDDARDAAVPELELEVGSSVCRRTHLGQSVAAVVERRELLKDDPRSEEHSLN